MDNLLKENFKELTTGELKTILLSSIDDREIQAAEVELAERNFEREGRKSPVVVFDNPDTMNLENVTMSELEVVLDGMVSLGESIQGYRTAKIEGVDFLRKSISELNMRAMPRFVAENNPRVIQLVCGAVVVDDHDNVLMLDTSNKKGNRIVNRLTIIQGHVDANLDTMVNLPFGDALVDTAQREIAEETTLDVSRCSVDGRFSIYTTQDEISMEHYGYISILKYDGDLKEDVENGIITTNEPDKHDVRVISIDGDIDTDVSLDNWAKISLRRIQNKNAL